MTLYFDNLIQKNVAAANGTNFNAMYKLKELLKTAGWTVTKSGTGTSGTYNASGDNLASAANFGTRSWFVVQSPSVDGYTRYICVQLLSSTSARIKVAWSDFSTGSPNADTVPGSSDEQVLTGSGTDASPTGSNFFDSDNTSNFYMYASDSTDKCSFGFFATQEITSSSVVYKLTTTVFVMERLQNTNALDIDPYIYSASYAPYGFNQNNIILGSTIFSGWYKKGLAGAAWTQYPICSFGSTSSDSILYYTNKMLYKSPFDMSQFIFPVIFSRNAISNINYKGDSVNWRLLCGTTLNTTKFYSSTNQFMVMLNQICIPSQ